MKNHWLEDRKMHGIADALALHFRGICFPTYTEMCAHYDLFFENKLELWVYIDSFDWQAKEEIHTGVWFVLSVKPKH